MDSVLQNSNPDFLFSALMLGIIGSMVIAYFTAVFTQNRIKRNWNRWRVVFFLAGSIVLAVAFLPQVVEWAHHDFRGHMIQHLLIGMIAPLGLVLSAPVTLVLRTLPNAAARDIIYLLRSPPLQVLSHPVTALGLNIGGMYILYLTPLYSISLQIPAVHYAVHIHFFLAGYLFCWSILAGPDTAPHQPGMRFRLFILFISIGAHAILGKLMYGHLYPRFTHHSAEGIQAAAQLMYYGGDIAELLLAIALFTMWYKNPASSRYFFISQSQH